MLVKIRHLLEIATTFAILEVVEPVDALTFSDMKDLDSPPEPQFPPDSVTQGQYESNDTIFFFQEKNNFRITEDVTVDITETGLYNGNDTTTSDVISAGTLVDSYYFSFDPEGTSRTELSTQPRISFDNPILGIITQSQSLNNSDNSLGRNSPFMYPTTNNSRGLERFERLTWEDDFTIEFTRMRASGSVDQVRVLTEIPFEFSPGLGLVLAVGLIGLWELRKRLSKQSEINS